MSSGCTKREIWEKYTGYKEEHGQLLRWMRELGYEVAVKPRRTKNTADNQAAMDQIAQVSEKSIEYFETLQLKKRIAELESKLKDAELKAIAKSTMVDIAEREFNIPIRKKYYTKPSKK